ncbi:MAG: GNAT family N-acetyltransferase [Candidatus Heimdallarchaeota archaeon]|nr:GNAT family N-acetyltransferase [Candidatus Heimdallarchaeota archaeon]
MQTGIFYSNFKNLKVIDSNKKKIGRVGDFILNKKNLHIRKFIIYGSFVEEKLEAMKIKEDIDPLLPVTGLNFDSLEKNELHTNLARNEMETTTSDWTVPNDAFLFSKLTRVNVLDDEDTVIGHVEDLMAHADMSYTLVISGSKLQELLQKLKLYNKSDLLVPSKFVKSIDDREIRLSVTDLSLSSIKHISLFDKVRKTKENYEASFDDLQSRYHYYVYEAKISTVQQELQKRSATIQELSGELTIRAFNTKDAVQTDQFSDLFNEIALTSVDPYEELTNDKVIDNFSVGSFLAYQHDNLVGYCITNIEVRNSDKVGIITGIGIHHKFRGKRLSTVFMKYIVKYFEENDVSNVQCDILINNDASIGLFTGLGLEKKGDFYLTSHSN